MKESMTTQIGRFAMDFSNLPIPASPVRDRGYSRIELPKGNTLEGRFFAAAFRKVPVEHKYLGGISRGGYLRTIYYMTPEAMHATRVLWNEFYAKFSV